MNDDNQFEKLSFWKLLGKENIEIPIIQRDYAQGRKNQLKVRNNFLNSLYDAFFKEPVELDFIYGSIEGNTLQPLDGQQRLTTLFLLHWYIASKEQKNDKAVMERLGKFTYETRTSSREFCNDLVSKSIDFNDLMKFDNEESGQNELSKTIMNTTWFAASWEKDPTISAMLIMLDAIHGKFKDKSGLWDKLISENNSPITFLYVSLKDFGLSDDLYIKMNARGKQLTPFENFKSQFEKYIEFNNFEEANITQEEKFTHMIDTIWTDLFWNYKEEQKDKSYNIDNKLINFIAGTAINYYAEKMEIAENQEEINDVRKMLSIKGRTKNVSDEAVKRERIERRINYISNNPGEVMPADFPAKDAWQYLVNCS